jgi:hypothetical protein
MFGPLAYRRMPFRVRRSAAKRGNAKDIEVGFDRVYLHNVGLNQADFISAFADKAAQLSGATAGGEVV